MYLVSKHGGTRGFLVQILKILFLALTCTVALAESWLNEK